MGLYTSLRFQISEKSFIEILLVSDFLNDLLIFEQTVLTYSILLVRCDLEIELSSMKKLMNKIRCFFKSKNIFGYKLLHKSSTDSFQ